MTIPLFFTRSCRGIQHKQVKHMLTCMRVLRLVGRWRRRLTLTFTVSPSSRSTCTSGTTSPTAKALLCFFDSFSGARSAVRLRLVVAI